MMGEQIRFSVIIPLYNKADYILNAVESVLAQTFPFFELIIVNDGSTDDSLLRVQQIRDSRLKVIDQPNRGVSAARNKGVSMALSQYITFLDADDWWHADYLLEMSRLICAFPEAKIYGCQYFWVKNGKIKGAINHESAGFMGYIDYCKAYTYAWWMPLHSNSTVIRKAIYDEMGGFKTNLKFGEDFDLWIRIVLKYKVAYLNQPLAYYNQNVVAKDRALGEKCWKKEEHFLFNLTYLDHIERENILLKKLLDGLHVRGLLAFYLRNDYPLEVKELLSKVDFSQQPVYYQWLYTWPRSLIVLYVHSKKVGSIVKQFLLKLVRSK